MPVHSFVSSHVLARASKAVADKLQPVLNAAACVVSGIHKYDRGLLRLLHSELHWLDVPELVAYELLVRTYGWLHGQAPQYVMDLRQPVFDVSSRQHLRSATRRVLFNIFVPLLSRWSAHRSGTYCQTVCKIRLLEETTSGAFKDTLDDTLYKSTAYTYLLTVAGSRYFRIYHNTKCPSLCAQGLSQLISTHLETSPPPIFYD